jgi:hypothetical protein
VETQRPFDAAFHQQFSVSVIRLITTTTSKLIGPLFVTFNYVC